MIIDNRFNRNNVHFSLVLLVCINIVSGADDCWWTGCQPNALAATGCDDFGRVEKAREACADGFKYLCCATTDEPKVEILADQCRWSECGPKNLTDSGCPPHWDLQSKTRTCAEGEGDQYLCCMKKSALLDYDNDFKITDRHGNVARYLYAALKKHQLSDSGSKDSGHGRKRAGENTEDADSGGDTIKRSSYGAGVKTESQRNPSPRAYYRNLYRHHKRQIPIYADIWDAEDDGSAADDDADHDDTDDVGDTDDTVYSGDTVYTDDTVYSGDTDDNGDTDVDDDAASAAEDQSQPVGEEPGWNCDGNRRMVGYYTSWSVNDMSDAMMEKLTHVIYSFLIPQPDGTVDFDTPTSLQKLQRLAELRKSHPQVKIMFAVGGGASSQQFSSIASSSELRKTFTDSVVRLANDNGLDGVDIDWEFPVVSSAVQGTPEDKTNFVLLMKELREALNANAAATGRSDPYLISFAGSAGQWALDPGFDLPGLLQYADFANAMAYDYFGVWGGSKWSAYTGPPAPLYPGTPSGFPEDFSHSNVDWTVGYYVEKIGSPDKINMGVPFYGWYWNNVGDPISADDPMWRTAQPVDGVYQGGATQWRRIQEDHLSDARFQQMFHEQCKTPYAWNEETKVFLGYEDQQSLGFKVNYAAEKNVGGLMIWAVDMDDDSLTLLNALHQAATESCEKSGLYFGS